jgi:hypothetical protein
LTINYIEFVKAELTVNYAEFVKAELTVNYVEFVKVELTVNYVEFVEAELTVNYVESAEAEEAQMERAIYRCPPCFVSFVDVAFIIVEVSSLSCFKATQEHLKQKNRASLLPFLYYFRRLKQLHVSLK